MENMSEEKKSAASELASRVWVSLNRTLFVNVVFGMFCTIPSFEGLEKMLQIFALIDALMLA